MREPVGGHRVDATLRWRECNVPYTGRRSARAPGRAVDRSGLTGGAGSFAVRVMLPRPICLDVRAPIPLATFGERRKRDRKLRRHRQKGEDGEKQSAPGPGRGGMGHCSCMLRMRRLNRYLNVAAGFLLCMQSSANSMIRTTSATP